MRIISDHEGRRKGRFDRSSRCPRRRRLTLRPRHDDDRWTRKLKLWIAFRESERETQTLFRQFSSLDNGGAR